MERKRYIGILPLMLAVSLSTPAIASGNTEMASQLAESRPIWPVAHRVLTTGGVGPAVKHGATAIEIDLQAWSTANVWAKSNDWWADHDGFAASAGDKASAMFDEIAKYNNQVAFVWLDIKNPDDCKESSSYNGCKFSDLVKLARDKLETKNINVLYGFYGAEKSEALPTISSDLQGPEAVALDGSYDEVMKVFGEGGAAEKVPPSKRVVSRGLYNLHWTIDKVEEDIKKLATARENKEIGQVFGWTISNSLFGDQAGYAKRLVKAGADGLIYGFAATYYYDHDDTKKAFGYVKAAADQDPEKYRLANIGDKGKLW